MTLEDREKIISNSYADLLLNYNGNQELFKDYANATVQIVDFFNAIIHVPLEQITDDIIMQRGYSAMPLLYGLISETSLEKSGITRTRSIPPLNLRGKGVLVGILDSGIDYTNPIFKYADNTTRIISIWDQTIFSDNYPLNTFYGTEFSRDQINNALKSDNSLSIVPTTDEIGHGTMLAGIAAGNEDPSNNFWGVAPDAELVIVKLKQAKPYLKDFFRIPESSICYQENDILVAINYLISVAVLMNRPISICIALGTSQGSHDGSDILSNYLSFQADNIGVSLVVAAGNEGNAKRHFYGVVNPAVGYQTVELNVGENDKGFSMELWGSSPSIFSIDIMSPTGEYIPRIAAKLTENRYLTFIFEQATIFVDYQMVEPQSGDQLILVRFRNLTAGIWRFKVYSRGKISSGFHIWLPMSGFISDNTYFITSNPYTTVLSLGNASIPITVTSYNPIDDSLYINASKGYTRLEAIKPDIAAPGVDIISPTIDQGFASISGTSPSAAHTAGATALLLEWGIVKGNLRNMSTINIKNMMIRGGRRNIDLEYPNKDWGYGILDLYNIFDSLRRGIQPPK